VNNNLNKVNNFITIDKGEKDGILSEMGVFNSQGVVGIVYSTSENFALVIPLLNSKSNISCRVKGTNSYSTLQWNGGDARYSYLVDLPRYAVFEKGDTVVTSGFSSIFPAGVPVGVIDNLEDAEDGLFFKARVELFVDFSSIENLFVVGNNKKEEQELLEKTIEKE
jgi:rod shape-determining protein MreC